MAQAKDVLGGKILWSEILIMIEQLLRLRFPQLERRYAVSRTSARRIRDDLVALNGGEDPGMDDFDPGAGSPRFELKPAKKAAKKRTRKKADTELTEKEEKVFEGA